MQILKQLLLQSRLLRLILIKCYQFYVDIQGFLGLQLLRLVPARVAVIQNESFSFVQGQKRNWMDALLRAGLIKQAGVFDNNSATLEEYHQNFWRNESGAKYHEHKQNLFTDIFLAHHAYIVNEISAIMQSEFGCKQLCEFGSGSGLVLNYLAENIPGIQRFIGIDLSDYTTQRNRVNFSHPKLEFVTADALTWLKNFGQPNSIFLTHNGVLEYFSQEKVESLLSFISEQCSPAVVIAIESISIDHNLRHEMNSKPLGKEFSFSHNYPYLFEKYGFQLKHMKPSYETLSYAVHIHIAIRGADKTK